jgi:hypothetical protein
VRIVKLDIFLHIPVTCVRQIFVIICSNMRTKRSTITRS